MRKKTTKRDWQEYAHKKETQIKRVRKQLAKARGDLMRAQYDNAAIKDELEEAQGKIEMVPEMDAELMAARGRIQKLKRKNKRYMKLPGPITVIDDHIEITLTPREEKLLTILIDNQGKVVPYEEIAHWMWGVTEERPYAAQLLRTICRTLRDKIGIERIETARGRGYIYL